MKRPARFILLFYFVPYVFLAMWVEWKNCPTGLLIWEIPIAVIPLAALAAVNGKLKNKRGIIFGNIINFAVSGGFVAALTFCDVSLNKCGNIWATYFKPLTAITLFLVLQGLLFFIQWSIYTITRPKAK